jgi:hypothetical protein
MASAYDRIIEKLFLDRIEPGATEVHFEREELVDVAEELGLKRPKNLGDLVYTFRYRRPLPPGVQAWAPQGTEWIIRGTGGAKYVFAAEEALEIEPRVGLRERKVPDATPGIISMYSLTDEQALLAIVRYNRLIDIFTGVSCYSLQSHWRTTVSGIGQVETDEVYVGLDRVGSHYVVPVQAKGGSDKLSRVQIEQDMALCADRFPELICRPIGAQFVEDNLVALFELALDDGRLVLEAEEHYRLAAPDEISDADLRSYRGSAAAPP